MEEMTGFEIWSQACAHLQELLHPDVYTRWIAVINPLKMESDTLTLSVENDFYQTWLEENYLPLIKSAVQTVTGSEVKIVFAVSRSTDSATPVRPGSGALNSDSQPYGTNTRSTTRSARKRPEPCLNTNFTFADFVVGPSNSFAHAACLAVAQAPARAYNPLFIYGGVGLGKTHLIQAIGHHVASNSNATINYISSEAFTNEYIDALQNRNLVSFRKKFRNTDLLLIDDIHFLAGKDRLQEEFFHTFNTLFDARKQILMTSDRPASEIANLEKRLVSRFEWGLVTELEQPDLETRIAILRNKQEHTKIRLPDEILLFIAKNIRSNIRRLEGALIRVCSYASLTGSRLTLTAVESLLRDTLEQEQATIVTFSDIQKKVAEHFDIRIADMTSKRRPQAVAFPRQVAMYLCRRLTPSSLPEIAGAFNKTHATVLHACKSVDKKLAADASLRQTVSQISSHLGKPFDVLQNV